MTAQEYIDDIKLRLLRLNVDLDLSDALIMTYINNARHEVQIATYSLFPERYATIGSTTYVNNTLGWTSLADANLSIGQTTAGYKSVNIQTVTLPIDVIDVYNVMVNWNSSTLSGQARSSNCRRIAKRELFTVQNHAWNAPSLDSMVYCVERIGNATFLHIADMSVAMADSSANPRDLTLETWYVSALSDLENVTSLTGIDDVDTVVPPDVEELVIYYAMMYCVESLHEEVAYDVIRSEVKGMEDALRINYAVQKQRVGSLLPSKEGVG